MIRPMSPVDALAEAAMSTFLRSFERRPGEVIRKQRPEVREALKRLTSDDALSLRVEFTSGTAQDPERKQGQRPE